MNITYVFYTEEQGLVCEVNLEVPEDCDEWEVEEWIAEDLRFRQWDWEDEVWGVYNGNEIRPVLD